MSKQLAEMLVKDRLITQAQLNEAITNGKDNADPVRYLIEKKYVAENKLTYYLGQKFGLPSINLTKFEIAPAVVKILSREHVKKYQAIPIQMNKGTLVVAMWNPINTGALESLKFAVKMTVEPVLTSPSAFDAAVSKYYGGVAMADAAIENYKKATEKAGTQTQQGLELVTVHQIDQATDNKDAPIIAIVNGILSEGIRRGASDIHVEPYEKRFRVRMRIDGVLHDVTEIPIDMKRAVIARLKIMSRMDIAESRVPQDGRIKLMMGRQEIDFRVNSMPTLFGEKVVLRMLSMGNLQLDLLKLGFEPKQLEVFKKGIYAPNGMVLVTGPTGSGKTTTLYSALSELNQITDNLSTAEDPVEYNLEGINQVQVQKEIGLTFASVLRALLRQDPDTILVGEIRDYETAEVAIQAALTGHLVLSTLHTNDAPSSITRIMNMGIEAFLVTSSVNTIVAQRLLRRVCDACKAPDPLIPQSKIAEMIAMAGTQMPTSAAKFMKGAGCPICAKTGYKGRVAIYEVLDFTTSLKEMVLKGESIIDIKRQAIKEGMKTLRMSAVSKAIEGVTTLEEALSLTME